MKKVYILLLALALILVVANVSMAAQTVTVDLFDLFTGTINATYEKPLDRQESLLFFGRFWNLEGDATGLGGGAGYRRYFERKASGFFAQGTAGINFMKNGPTSATLIDICALSGYKLILDYGITAEAGLGAAMYFGEFEGYDLGGFDLVPRIALGYTW